LGQRVQSISLRKLTPLSCSAAIILCAIADAFSVFEYLQSQFFLSMDPQYILLLLNNQLPNPARFLSSLKLIHLSAKYLFAIAPTLSSDITLQLICLWCSHDDPYLVQQISQDRHSIDAAWWALHRNMSGSKVFTLRPMLQRFEGLYQGNCRRLDHQFRGDVRLCLIQLLSDRLNFQFIHSADTMVSYDASEAYRKHQILLEANRSDLKSDELSAFTIDNWQATTLYR
jgi:hypothetical protein